MKTLLLLLAIALLTSCARKQYQVQSGVDFSTRYDMRRAIAPATLGTVSGGAWGVHKTVVHHPDRIPSGWNRQLWDGRVSWTNKYRHGDPAAGPAYPGSTTFLAWTTDAKHLFGTVHRATLFGSAVVIGLGEQRPVWHYLVDAGISFVAFSVGFHGVYSVAFMLR